MIVGHGMLARAFSQRYGARPDIVIFASGVSNSAESLDAAFERERLLLETTIAAKPSRLVYFGSCASDGKSESAYLRHKHRMESSVIASHTGLVLRLPQVVGRTRNPNTLTNFLHDRISSGTRFSLWSNAVRNLLDVDDLVPIASAIIENAPAGSGVHDIASRISHPMPAIAAMFEHVLGRSGVYTCMHRGDPLKIEARLAWTVAEEMGIDLGPGYAESVIRKYYGHED